MNRRNFLNRVVGATAGLGLAGAGALAINKMAETRPRENQTITYRVQGFT
jgi:hypothetical protein